VVSRLKLDPGAGPRDEPTDETNVVLARAQEIMQNHIEAMLGRPDAYARTGIEITWKAGQAKVVTYLVGATEQAEGGE
jgi:hypothetical protein